MFVKAMRHNWLKDEKVSEAVRLQRRQDSQKRLPASEKQAIVKAFAALETTIVWRRQSRLLMPFFEGGEVFTGMRNSIA